MASAFQRAKAASRRQHEAAASGKAKDPAVIKAGAPRVVPSKKRGK